MDFEDYDDYLPPIDKTFGIKYLGSKKEIIPEIWRVISKLDIKTAIDVFSGTTRVAQYLRRNRIKMITSDLSWATTCYAQTWVHNTGCNKHLASMIAEMNNLVPVHGWLSENYTGYPAAQSEKMAEGRCFQMKNAMKADAARDWIDQQTYTHPWEKSTLITSVIVALNAVDNTVGLQQAYLKEWCPRSSNDIAFKLPPCIYGPTGQHFEGDCFAIDYPEADLAYLDPPYSSHSYASYYHIWDSIARWDKPETAMKSRRRVDRISTHPAFKPDMVSRWNRKSKLVAAFDDELEKLPVKYALISYSDDSLVNRTDLEAVCQKHGQVDFIEVDYTKHIMSQIGNAADKGRTPAKNQTNKEWLVLVRKS